MALRSSAIKGIAKGFDLERRIKESPTKSIVLLKRTPTGDTVYSPIKAYDTGFILRFSTFRNQSEIEIATEDDLSPDVPSVMGIALIEEGGSGKICMISNGDVVPPDDDRFTWLFYGSIKVNEVYEVIP